VEAAENLLTDMGFTDFRVRTDGRMARLQLRQADWDKIVPARDAIYNALLQYFEHVVLDMKMGE
jgi:PP-loop superfamily ATP-utilizing enzyme